MAMVPRATTTLFTTSGPKSSGGEKIVEKFESVGGNASVLVNMYLSGLNAVSTIQRIGKRLKKRISAIATPCQVFPRFLLNLTLMDLLPSNGDLYIHKGKD